MAEKRETALANPKWMYPESPTDGVCGGEAIRVPIGTTMCIQNTSRLQYKDPRLGSFLRHLCTAQVNGKTYYGWFDDDLFD